MPGTMAVTWGTTAMVECMARLAPWHTKSHAAMTAIVGTRGTDDNPDPGGMGDHLRADQLFLGAWSELVASSGQRRSLHQRSDF